MNFPIILYAHVNEHLKKFNFIMAALIIEKRFAFTHQKSYAHSRKTVPISFKSSAVEWANTNAYPFCLFKYHRLCTHCYSQCFRLKYRGQGSYQVNKGSFAGFPTDSVFLSFQFWSIRIPEFCIIQIQMRFIVSLRHTVIYKFHTEYFSLPTQNRNS